MTAPAPLLSVIIPVHNGTAVLPAALGALAATDLPRELWELVVVDDASTDGSPALAAQYANTLVRLTGRSHGPSFARNRGAEAAHGDILVFVDADVCVHPDTLRRFAWVFADEVDVVAAFGSYDDKPTAPGLVSQYRNLLHHYVHQQSGGDAETFWSGCGAVRRSVFIEVGMYNEWHFSRPQIEDIELGHRLRDHGHRIVLRPEIQGTHLKRWTLLGVLATDLKDRGVPWMRLLIQRGMTNGAQTLNLRWKERGCTALAWLALLPPVAAFASGNPHWLSLSLAPIGLILASNLPLYTFFRRHGGVAFALGVVPLHLAYYIENGVSVLVAMALQHAVGDPKPSATVQAFAERGVLTWPPVPRPADTLGGPLRGTPPDAGRLRGMAPNPSRAPTDETIRRRAAFVFQPLHKFAFGVAIGAGCGLALATATMVALVQPDEPAIALRLLRQYFYGYQVSWAGVVIGFFWAFVMGFTAGWFVAFCRNLAMAVSLASVRPGTTAGGTRGFIEHL